MLALNSCVRWMLTWPDDGLITVIPPRVFTGDRSSWHHHQKPKRFARALQLRPVKFETGLVFISHNRFIIFLNFPRKIKKKVDLSFKVLSSNKKIFGRFLSDKKIVKKFFVIHKKMKAISPHYVTMNGRKKAAAVFRSRLLGSTSFLQLYNIFLTIKCLFRQPLQENIHRVGIQIPSPVFE